VSSQKRQNRRVSPKGLSQQQKLTDNRTKSDNKPFNKASYKIGIKGKNPKSRQKFKICTFKPTMLQITDPCKLPLANFNLLLLHTVQQISPRVCPLRDQIPVSHQPPKTAVYRFFTTANAKERYQKITD
jgi:hypothetical protein